MLIDYVVFLLLDFQNAVILLLYSIVPTTPLALEITTVSIKVLHKTGVISTIQNSFKDYPSSTLHFKTNKQTNRLFRSASVDNRRMMSLQREFGQQMVFS